MEPAVSAIVVIGGSPPEPAVTARLGTPRFVIAADSGLDHAFALGLDVDLLVGDLDSVSPQGLALAVERGIAIEQHRPDKDATDTELAIEAAVARGAQQVVVVSGGGDRFDHEIGALAALTKPSLVGIDIEAWWGLSYLRVLHGPCSCEVAGGPGSLVSLLAVHGDAHGISTIGLRYPLSDETLWAGSARGVSNVFLGTDARIDVVEGTMLVIVPHALRPPAPINEEVRS